MASSNTGVMEGAASGPFGIGTHNGAVGGGNGESGPQNVQHGSGADVRNAPVTRVGWPPLRPEAGAVDWGIFSQPVGGGDNGGGKEVGEDGDNGGKRSRGINGGRSRSPMLGKFGGGVRTQKRKGDKSPMIQPRAGKSKEASSQKVEPPPGMEHRGGGGENGGNNNRNNIGAVEELEETERSPTERE